jgi:hypothetical protein
MTPGDRMAPADYRASSPRSIALAGVSLFPGQAKMARGSGLMEIRLRAVLGTPWHVMLGGPSRKQCAMEDLRQLIGLPPELFAALGEVTARYGQIDHLLTMTIRRTATLSYDKAFEYVELAKYNDTKNIDVEEALSGLR